jgi:ParB family transcriptional regulator, chromosome partitioning protein
MCPSQELRELPVQEIEPNLSQPRRYFDEQALEELAGSVRERGVLQPVLVRPDNEDKHQFIGGDKNKYQLVAGERRWRAAKLAGLQTIPALISTYDDLAALEIGLIENMARQALNPVEEARACSTLVKELGLTYRQLSERVGRSEATMWNVVHLLDLSGEIIELLERGELSKSHGIALLLAKDPQVGLELARKAIEHGWSVQTLNVRARESNNSAGHSSAPLNHRSDSGHSSAPLNHHSASPGSLLQEDGSDDVARNIARIWGDALGAEVMVRALPSRRLRVEFVFDSPEGALAMGGRIGEAIARGTKRR